MPSLFFIESVITANRDHTYHAVIIPHAHLTCDHKCYRHLTIMILLHFLSLGSFFFFYLSGILVSVSKEVLRESEEHFKS